MDGTLEFVAHLLLTMYHAIRRGFMDVVTTDIEDLTGKPPKIIGGFLRREHKSSVERRR